MLQEAEFFLSIGKECRQMSVSPLIHLALYFSGSRMYLFLHTELPAKFGKSGCSSIADLPAWDLEVKEYALNSRKPPVLERRCITTSMVVAPAYLTIRLLVLPYMDNNVMPQKEGNPGKG